MATSGNVFRGVVHGKTIELEVDAGLPDGQEVRVVMTPASVEEKLSPAEYLRRSAGAWADDPEGVDAFVEWNRKQRELGGLLEIE
jgi:hypothetical protein